MGKQEQETITILEEVQIPGTDVILEAGDKIEVESRKVEEGYPNDILSSIHRLKSTINDYVDVISGDDWKTIRIEIEYLLSQFR